MAQAAVGDKGVRGPWNYWQVSSVAVEKTAISWCFTVATIPILEYKPDGEFIGPWGE